MCFVHFAHLSARVPRVLVHGNYSAPVEEALERGGMKVLDAGCGAGNWSLDMAKDYPKCHFTGTDKANVFPKAELPPNCEFFQADTVRGLPFADNTFDYVYQRFMFLGFSTSDWAASISELIRVTKPGALHRLSVSSLFYHDFLIYSRSINRRLD
ncbi:S-adenosyl-L-methionine-dependent methyltransferase [Jimgerdemannia flammicorona]|uniref:S-adenosyl-L-methionine-dependent methyltransferase n=1 Tax=Jimgerdemannia flammicorona TaxID=994334 RepID=A0A433CWD6_9FUNG|nr:S-adenosyl-L-methionine-dependent methyltransferase [Jimgerdemannia flammicorona]